MESEGDYTYSVPRVPSANGLDSSVAFDSFLNIRNSQWPSFRNIEGRDGRFKIPHEADVRVTNVLVLPVAEIVRKKSFCRKD